MVSSKSRGVLPRALALLAVLAITTGWSAPAPAVITSSAAAATSRDTTGAAHRWSSWQRALDVRSAAAASADAARIAESLADRHAPRRPAFDAPTSPSGSPKAHSTEPTKVTSRTEKAGDPNPAKPKTHKPRTDKPKADKPSSQGHVYRGVNHFWIPSLGMSYGIHWYGCKDSFYPKNLVYRWGCAGDNNVYLLGHAYGVMKPLHDLYVRGDLQRGMVALFANAQGHVTKYKVTEWRVVRPTEVAWQIAAQPVPSMTLQTCIGKNSQYRLNVRLVAVD